MQIQTNQNLVMDGESLAGSSLTIPGTIQVGEIQQQVGEREWVKKTLKFGGDSDIM